MTLKSYTDAKIIDIKPCSEYEGKTYDQVVYVQLINDDIIGLFDGNMLVNPQMIGQIKNVIIGGITIICKINECKHGILPSVSKDQPPWSGFTFYGQILSIDHSSLKMMVDTGMGCIIARPDRPQLIDFHKGDFVSVYMVRADLEDID